MAPSPTRKPRTSELRFIAELLKARSVELGLASALLLLEALVALSIPWLAGKVVADLLRSHVPGTLMLAWIGVMAALAGISFSTGLLLARVAAHLTGDLELRVYDHLQSLPLRWHQERKRGEVLALLANDVTRLGSFLAGTIAPLLPLLVTCAGATVLLLRIDLRAGLLVVAAVPAIVVAVKYATRRFRPLALQALDEEARKYGIAEQNLAALPLIKAFTSESTESDRFAASADEARRLSIKQASLSAALSPIVRFLSASAVVALLWIGGQQLAAGAIAPGDLVSLLLYGMLLTQPVTQLAGVYGQLRMAQGAATRLRDLIDEAPEQDQGKGILDLVRGELRFEGLRFGYPGRSLLFNNLDWSVASGETVAITGVNGAGKTTLALLAMRFVEPEAGRITLDGIEVRELPLSFLRRQFGLVSQQVLLFNASIAFNIGYGRPGATRDQIEVAARAARAHEFINELPLGYDTVIGDEGVRLSGGQKQRIALARALLKDAPILILDEATAMFDPEGERGFVDECREALRKRTVLIITHRPASLALADRVFKLEAGRLEELGPRPRLAVDG